ncbi:MAG: hypothetical protein ACTSWX_10375 [Promethearchaeota archaeon]
MEHILGVIDDLIDKFKNGTSEEQFDAKEELRININQFKDKLSKMVNDGNQKAKEILDQLQNISFS